LGDALYDSGALDFGQFDEFGFQSLFARNGQFHSFGHQYSQSLKKVTAS
jgi:hypothetical protein